MAYLSGLLKKIEGSLVAGAYKDYLVPPVVVPGLIIAAVFMVALHGWW